jgi:C4-dicarboxylate-specific signal transduction histidine kinase
MFQSRVRFPVKCPICGSELLTEMAGTDITSALINNRRIRLYASCHDVSWDASEVEVRQLREYVEAIVDQTHTNSQHKEAVREHAQSEAMREAEKALHRAQAELVHVSRATTLGQLAASIAHEISQPLTAVMANASACTRFLAAEPPNLVEAVEAASQIASDAHLASEIIRRIRQFLQRGSEERLPLDLVVAVSDGLALIGGEIRRKDITLRVAAADGLPEVLGDRVQLEQVVVNLAMNAIEAMTSVLERERVLEVRVDRHDAHVLRVSIRDTGIGLSAELRDKMFDAFQTTKPGGMGMGLTISRKIIEAHGGRLWAVPNSDHGETFQFTLPVGSCIRYPAPQ